MSNLVTLQVIINTYFQHLIHFYLPTIVGTALIISGIFDALKYSIQATKIQRNKSAKNISRRFINWAIMNDLIKLVYAIVVLKDFYISITSSIALITMMQMFWMVYLYYPYKTYPRRGLIRRPGIIQYTINSWLPNHKRKRL